MCLLVVSVFYCLCYSLRHSNVTRVPALQSTSRARCSGEIDILLAHQLQQTSVSSCQRMLRNYISSRLQLIIYIL
jgi:hypothetical protein